MYAIRSYYDDLVDHGNRKGQVFQEQGDVGLFLIKSLADVGVDRGGAVIVAEGIGLAAGEILHVDDFIHVVRCPAKEYDPLLVASEGLYLGEHALLAGGNQGESLEIEHILIDHRLNDLIAVVAFLDAVNLVIELVGEFGDVTSYNFV